jgi:hypothetical protein
MLTANCNGICCGMILFLHEKADQNYFVPRPNVLIVYQYFISHHVIQNYAHFDLLVK